MNNVYRKPAVWVAAGLTASVLSGLAIVGERATAAPGAADAVESTFVPINPCRLFDFRPGPTQVGPRSTPLGPNEIHELQVTGPNGQCDLPASAVAVAMNVTAVNSTAPSYLQMWPADDTRPKLGSSLNYLPGLPPTPNKVDIKLSDGGAIKLFNLNGTIDVLGDVVGYYSNEGMQQLQSSLDTKADAVAVYSKAQIDAMITDLPAFADVYNTSETFNRTETITQIALGAADKADKTVVTALDATVAALDTTVAGKADAADVDALETTVAGKADAATVDALGTTVAGKADTATVDALGTTVAGKADTATVDALGTTVGTLDTALTDAVAALNLALDGKVDTADVYGKTEQEDFFMGRDPDMVMNQGTGDMDDATGAPLPGPSFGLPGVTLTATLDGLLELVGPAAISDAFAGRVDYQLNALRICTAAPTGTAALGTVTITVRHLDGSVPTATGFTPVAHPTLTGCYNVDVSAVGSDAGYFVTLDVTGGLTDTLLVTGIEGTWGTPPAP